VKQRLTKVALSIDCSHNLSNSSHLDVNDASVGFSVWTETSRIAHLDGILFSHRSMEGQKMAVAFQAWQLSCATGWPSVGMAA
jgi:hypothetical protein